MNHFMQSFITDIILLLTTTHLHLASYLYLWLDDDKEDIVIQDNRGEFTIVNFPFLIVIQYVPPLQRGMCISNESVLLLEGFWSRTYPTSGHGTGYTSTTLELISVLGVATPPQHWSLLRCYVGLHLHIIGAHFVVRWSYTSTALKLTSVLGVATPPQHWSSLRC